MTEITSPQIAAAWSQVEARLKNQMADAAPISGFLRWFEYQAALAESERYGPLVEAVHGAVHHCSAAGCMGIDEKTRVLITSLERLIDNESVGEGTERHQLELFFRTLARLS